MHYYWQGAAAAAAAAAAAECDSRVEGVYPVCTGSLAVGQLEERRATGWPIRECGDAD